MVARDGYYTYYYRAAYYAYTPEKYYYNAVYGYRYDKTYKTAEAVYNYIPAYYKYEITYTNSYAIYSGEFVHKYYVNGDWDAGINVSGSSLLSSLSWLGYGYSTSSSSRKTICTIYNSNNSTPATYIGMHTYRDSGMFLELCWDVRNSWTYRWVSSGSLYQYDFYTYTLIYMGSNNRSYYSPTGYTDTYLINVSYIESYAALYKYGREGSLYIIAKSSYLIPDDNVYASHYSISTIVTGPRSYDSWTANFYIVRYGKINNWYMYGNVFFPMYANGIITYAYTAPKYYYKAPQYSYYKYDYISSQYYRYIPPYYAYTAKIETNPLWYYYRFV